MLGGVVMACPLSHRLRAAGGVTDAGSGQRAAGSGQRAAASERLGNGRLVGLGQASTPEEWPASLSSGVLIT
jgi:hypothetical protein